MQVIEFQNIYESFGLEIGHNLTIIWFLFYLLLQGSCIVRARQ